MVAISNSVKTSLYRQVVHWHQAASRLSSLESLASGTAWHGVDFEVANLLKAALKKSIDNVLMYASQLRRQIEISKENISIPELKERLLHLRDSYLKAEMTVNFYTVALNSRTTASVASLLRACDILCRKSMEPVLIPLGKPVPSVMTYIDKGIGASILKAGLKLWDGSISPVAAIKVTAHNLFRPTSIIHEAGHQVAHITNWNDELAAGLRQGLYNHPKAVRSVFASWASEVAADVFAFTHTGFAAVAALHDVVSGPHPSVFMFIAHDPHPISYVRIMLGIELCKQFYGKGPWDELQSSFAADYDINLMKYPSVELIKMCLVALPDVVNICMRKGYMGFSGRSLAQLVPPENVSPANLQKLEYVAGPSLYTSHAWIWKECLRLMALNGLKIGSARSGFEDEYKKQQDWMMKLGFSIDLN
jgi:hypothetical protein